MAVFRVNKSKDYTTMANYHLKDEKLSLDAKGLLSLMQFLMDEGEYSMRGLYEICKETKDTVNIILKELEINGYIVYKNNLRHKNQVETIEGK